MNRSKLIPLAVGGALAMLAFGWILGGSFSGGHDHGAAGAGAGAGASDVWTCAMHPQIQQPKAGKCPICAMDLVPLSKMGSRQGGPRQYAMSESARQLARISTSPVERRPVQAEIRLVGKVAFDETRTKTVAARFPARMDNLYVDFTGIEVREGDHLAHVYSPELLTAQTELLSALKFNSNVETARDKLRLWGLSEEKIKAIEEREKTTDRMDIDTPMGGIVIKKHVNEGDYVKTGEPLFTIADLHHVWVMLDAYESDLPWLRFGQTLEFSADAAPGQVFGGQIAFIDPQVTPMTQTIRVRVNAENPAHLLKPGMLVKAVVKANLAKGGRVISPELAGKWISPMHPEIVSDEPGKCTVCGMDLVRAEDLGYIAPSGEQLPLVIPSSAVLQTGKRSVVYLDVSNEDGPLYEGREVVLGPRAGDEYVVESGLEEGDRVVTEGAFKIDSALQILAKPSMMSIDEDTWKVSPADWPHVLSHYLEWQRALSEDEIENAKKAVAVLAEIESAATDEQVAAATAAAGAAVDLEGHRPHFEAVSKRLIPILDQAPDLEATLYTAHCPMAFKNKGADWIQSGETVANPYFGLLMHECGTVTRTFEPKAKE